jgi:hypothetical protein
MWKQKFAAGVTKLMPPDEIRRFDGSEQDRVQQCEYREELVSRRGGNNVSREELVIRRGCSKMSREKQ